MPSDGRRKKLQLAGETIGADGEVITGEVDGEPAPESVCGTGEGARGFVRRS